MRQFRLLALLIAGTFCPPGMGVHGQGLLQPWPLTHFHTIDPVVTGIIAGPGPALAPQPLATRPAVPASPPAATPQPLAGMVLRHLPNNAQGLRLGGEISSSEWPVYLTNAQAAQPLKFQLGYLSAVSNLPEASQLSILVNDVSIGEIKIDAPHKVLASVHDIPADLLKPGFNSLRLVASQRHRVDCSLSATYELWTQIDATQTGFLIPAADQGANALEDIPALPPAPQGGMPMRVLMPGATNAGAVNQMMRMVEIVAIRGRFEQPLVELENRLAVGPGVNIAVGLRDDLAKLDGLSGIDAPDGPSLEFLPATPARRATLVASGRTAAEVTQALDLFAAFGDSKGSAQGLRAARAFPGYKVEGGSRTRLRDLGVISQDFNGHLFHASVNIVMPPDFYPADYAKFSLELAGGYAPGLATGAQIVISINAKIAVGSSLAKSGGEVFKGRIIDLPLGMLRPGLNRLDLDAHVPSADDATCDPLAAASGRKRFLLLDETELVIPVIARVALSPNLAITATGGFPFAGTKLNSHLYIPVPDSETVAAATTLLARMSLSAGEPLNLKLSLVTPPLEDGSTLVVGAAPNLPPAALAIAGLDAAQLAQIWKPRAFQPKSEEESQALSKYEALTQARIALQRNFPAECRMRDTRVKAKAAAAFAATASKPPKPAADPAAVVGSREKPVGLAAQWDETVNGKRSWMRWPAWARLPDWDGFSFGPAWNWALQQASWGRDQLAGKAPGEGTSVVDETASLLLAQKNHGSSGEGIWTVVTAPTPSALKQSIFCLVDPRVWSQVGGEIAALDTNEAKVNSQAATDARFITTQALSYSNLRLISAGWFSLNRWAYVALMLAMAMLLAMVTLLFVRNIGRRA